MSKIKRYDPETYVCNGLGRPGIMREDIDGCYVDYDDFSEIKAKADALENLWESVFINAKHLNQELNNELSRWSENNTSINENLTNKWFSSEREHQLREMGFLK